ncbi:flagellar biosynthetic protein FliO [Affinirhizobium pseudoryzae]|jgi:hypothetical protein|uniref:flagellar biosynthetic protein FliO n=1 Tax=Allorhizobium pseudoryzae TaxID=379684 RepID=UPI0013EDA4BD|nr:flagellar biosynthetic protein FliO [Allorhizobium pseudoryzae]
MFEDLMSDYGSRLFIAIAGVGLGLLCLVVVLMLMRRRQGPAPFLRGGKNRQPRLQVLDAAAVDARRRIVLIRRDDVEHLVMIGGPTDVVIESGIGAAEARPVSLTAPEAEPPALAEPAAEPRLQAPPRPPQLSAPSAAPLTAVEPAPIPTMSLRERVAATPASAAPRREPRPSVAPKAEPAAAAHTTQAPQAPQAPQAAAQPDTQVPNPRVFEPVTPPPRAEEPRAPEPRVTEPAVSPRPARDTMAEIEAPAPSRPTVETNVPDIGAASDALDAARRRVFQPALDRTPPASQSAAPAPSMATAAAAPDTPPPATPAAMQPENPAPRGLGSDFDRILEEEMANNLADVHPAPAAAQPASAFPRRDPASPRLTGATPEPSLQQEVARIFGEMSVTRDDRP